MQLNLKENAKHAEEDQCCCFSSLHFKMFLTWVLTLQSFDFSRMYLDRRLHGQQINCLNQYSFSFNKADFSQLIFFSVSHVPTFGKTLGETALSGSKLENLKTKNTTWVVCLGCSQAKDVLTFSDMILLRIFHVYGDHKPLGSPVLGLSSQSNKLNGDWVRKGTPSQHSPSSYGC